MSVIDIKVPVIGESISEVTLSQWLKENGSIVKIDEPICEFESDKATLELPAEKGGKLIWVAEEGDDLAIGAVVAQIDTSFAGAESDDKTNTPTPQADTPPTAEKQPSKETYATGHPSPAASKLMNEHGLTTEDITATGKDGRITKEDVLKALEAKNTEQKAAKTTPPPKKEAPKEVTAPATNSASFSRNSERKKMSRMRRTIARRLQQAKNETAMLTTFNEVDLAEVMALRKRYQERFVAKYGIKLGFMSLFAKACAKVLIEMPAVNAIWDEDHLIYHDYADISIAVSTPTGLVVPVVHNVESLQFHEIELKIKELAGKARNGNLTLQEMTGGTFSITNGGVFGSMLSTPILNRPQSAILGMHNIIQRPVAVNGEVKIRPMMYLALSYDHRVIDGSSAVTFLKKVKELLEDPTALLLDL